MFIYKYCRPTDNEKGHTKVFKNDIYLGYIIKNRSKFRTLGHNYSFISDYIFDDILHASNRQKLINQIEKYYKNYTPNKTKLSNQVN